MRSLVVMAVGPSGAKNLARRSSREFVRRHRRLEASRDVLRREVEWTPSSTRGECEFDA